jgi:thiamine-phosphate pyrophosphorylase
MNFNTFYSDNFYFFTNQLTENNKQNLIKFKNISIIYEESLTLNNNNKELLKIIKFCKENKIKVYVKDNIRTANKFNLNGVFLSGSNKIPILNNNSNLKINFKIIGSAHNQIEYFFKKRQSCEDIFLSPVFKNAKYRQTQILTINKFNLISKEWKCNLFALGGINLFNIKKIYITKSKGIGFVSFINDFKIKKPVYFLNKRAF